MKHARWIVLGVSFLLFRCGGIARLGTPGDQGGERGSGGASTDSGIPVGGSGFGSGGRDGVGGKYRASGGRPGTGGRAIGGRVGSGGSIVGSGGFVESGGASFDAGIAGGFGTGGTRVFDAGTDPARNRVPAGHVCDRLTTIQCAAEQYCCSGVRSFGACKQSMANACTGSLYFDQVSANPAVGYDIDRAEAAFSEFEKRASACDPTIMAWALSDAGFRGVARGTVPPGGSCLSFPDGGNPVDAIGLIGSCADPEVNACMSLNGTDWTCVPRGQMGSRCLTDLNCADGFFCDYAFGSPNHCAPKKPVGAICSTLLDCESSYCPSGVCGAQTVDGAYCLPY